MMVLAVYLMPNSLTSTLETHLYLEPTVSFSAAELEAEEIYETLGVVRYSKQ